MSITVLKPGLCTSLQDRGRFGYQHLGVSPSGAMDELAHRMANLLVGNTQDYASLEITLQGPTLRFEQACLFALCGADLQARLNDQAIPSKRPILALPGSTLSFKGRLSGMRAYLAVHGGFAVEPVLGSQSTLLRSKFGGWQGRKLERDDQVPVLTPLHLTPGSQQQLEEFLGAERIYMPAALNPAARDQIRLIPGEHLGLFAASSQQRLFGQNYRIATSSERMGYRLEGKPLFRQHDLELLSAPTSFGTVQVPNDGQPIILMADRQTTGGYAKIGQIAAVDLPQLAQLLPGTNVSFELIRAEQAAQLDQQRESALQRLSSSLESLRAQLSKLTGP